MEMSLRGYDYFSSVWWCPLRLSVFLEACSGYSLTWRVQEGICDKFLCSVVGTRLAEGRWDSGVRSHTVGQRLRQRRQLYLDGQRKCYPTLTLRGARSKKFAWISLVFQGKTFEYSTCKECVFDSPKGGVRLGGTCLLTV